MGFDFYFTGVSFGTPAADYLIESNACLLLSQLNERSSIKKWVDKFKEMGRVPIKLFIDSGAFSAWTKGSHIDVDEYIDFINENKDYFEVCASVDDIPGVPLSNKVASPEEVAKSCENTWQNFLYMRSKMLDVTKLLYTFHIGEPWEYLERALNYKDDKGPLTYIALGGMVGKKAPVLEQFLSKATQIIKKSNNPNIKVHAFGMTNLTLLERFNLLSADSTTWVKLAGYGNILINGKTYCVSDRQELSEDNVINKNIAVQEAVQDIVTKRGFTIQELSEDSNKRALFNMMDYKEWADNYTYKEINCFKNELF